MDGGVAWRLAVVSAVTILRQVDVPEAFTYHHIELAEHGLVLG